MRGSVIHKIARDERGAALLEFAFIAPVLCLVLLGGFDTAHTLYVRATLQGIIQKVGRDSALEGNDVAAQQTALDNKVRAQVRALVNNSTITMTRRFYRTFSTAAAAQAETWTDTNSNGRCDAGEPYSDANLNSTWDSDGGNSGQGGAKDTTLYTVRVSYARMFPLYKVIGVSSTTNVSATTVLKNQPYGDQSSYGTPVVRNCP